MHRVRPIHWNAAEAEERAGRLRSAGCEVVHEMLDPVGLRELRGDPPDAVVIDLGRLPSHGRDVAMGIRKYKATRHVPLVFVDGDPEKVARIKELLPDALYTTWSEIRSSVERAIAEPPADPEVPRSLLAGYSGTPLPKKLGIKANSAVVLVDAPAGFEKTLGELPEDVVLSRQISGRPDVTLWFVRSRDDLEHGVEQMGATAGAGRLWIVWPKKSSGFVSDLSQTIVRRTGLAAGLVDFKICAIDAIWSGLCFTRRKDKVK